MLANSQYFISLNKRDYTGIISEAMMGEFKSDHYTTVNIIIIMLGREGGAKIKL